MHPTLDPMPPEYPKPPHNTSPLNNNIVPPKLLNSQTLQITLAPGYLKKLMTDTHNAAMLDKVYVILMDSDTFWSVANIKHIWNRFDCARNKKKVVLSTEMSCWVGRYCQAADLAR